MLEVHFSVNTDNIPGFLTKSVFVDPEARCISATMFT
jgi:hypothetical protein